MKPKPTKSWGRVGRSVTLFSYYCIPKGGRFPNTPVLYRVLQVRLGRKVFSARLWREHTSGEAWGRVYPREPWLHPKNASTAIMRPWLPIGQLWQKLFQ